jgi:hypothetical protein
MRRNSLKTTVVAAMAASAVAVGSTAHAQEPDTLAAGDNIVLQCSDIFGPGTPGTVVITPTGNFNANCNPFAPSPSEVGGAIVAQCAVVFGEEFRGNIVEQPNGHFKGHCF